MLSGKTAHLITEYYSCRLSQVMRVYLCAVCHWFDSTLLFQPTTCNLRQFCVKLCLPLTHLVKLMSVLLFSVSCLLFFFCLIICCRPMWLRHVLLLLLMMLPTIANPAAHKPSTANIWSTTHDGRFSSHPPTFIPHQNLWHFPLIFFSCILFCTFAFFFVFSFSVSTLIPC